MNIRQATDSCIALLARCDFSFMVDAEYAEPFDGTRTVPVEPPYQKAYGFDPDELAEYLDGPDSELFVAELSGRLVGYLAVSRGWNHFAVIEDIAVDAQHRGSGIARHLMDAAVGWARQENLAGVRLETQSNNVTACRFYNRYGFKLGGYDRYLYSGIHPNRQEVAMFWYLLNP
ncbi:GNAT family N-acetyltransferase [Ectopseudomonas hydrolytica]|uniref:GNAT family N-acetyltransferase n=1 Tax=Ectopseudomonas hydrolytica TaxID=2493633 RepID=UPI00376EE54C